MGHIFDKLGMDSPAVAPEKEGGEVFETLLRASLPLGGAVRLERIVSFGVREGEWYDQGWDEWVMVVRGAAALEWGDGSATELAAGDYLLIEAHRRHRVLRTSPECVWLALHLGEE